MQTLSATTTFVRSWTEDRLDEQVGDSIRYLEDRDNSLVSKGDYAMI